jgi:hypothetical protein
VRSEVRVLLGPPFTLNMVSGTCNMTLLEPVHAGVAELADAPDLGSGGRPWGFESLHPHQEAGRANRAAFLLIKTWSLFVNAI